VNNNGNSVAPATPCEDSLTILREVSHVYETMRGLRKRAARVAHDGGATYQQLSDALGINRSSAFALINKDAA
jgi:hypothetical protein